MIKNSKEELLEVIKELVTESKRVNISAKTRLIDDLELDSLGLISLFLTLEMELEVNLSDYNILGVKTVGDLLDLIDKVEQQKSNFDKKNV